MRIALVCERVEAWRGGAETSTLQFAQRLADRGCAVTLFTTTRGAAAMGVDTVTVQTNSASRTYRTVVFERRVAEAVAGRAFDIVHAVLPSRAANVYEPRGGAIPETIRRNIEMRRSALTRAAKRFATGFNLKYRALLALEGAMMRRMPPPHVIAISEYVARQFREHYGVADDRLHLVFNGIEPSVADEATRRHHAAELRRQYELQRHEQLVLCVAHNFRLKGVARLIDAVARLPGAERGQVRVIVVGRDNPISYARRAQRLGVADRIVFAGSTQRIHAFYDAADMVVHPTYYDPCSRVVLEALAAGVPVITTRYNGAAEVMTDGREGFVLDSPDDVVGMAQAIGRLLDPPTRAACAQAAAALRDRVTMERHTDGVLAVYEQVVKERR